MKLLKLFNPENLSESELNNLPKRTTTRAVIQNEQGEIALLYSNKFNYHEIPGVTLEKAIGLFNEIPTTDNNFRNYIKERGLLFLNEVKKLNT